MPTPKSGKVPEPASMRILSSSHLASGAWPELSELEFGLVVAHNAFSRWLVRCMQAAGGTDLTSTDVQVLHHVHHRERSKKLADICFTLNYEDAHVISYALKKLVGMKLLSRQKIGKEVYYATTDAGRTLVERYREVRDRCLLPAVPADSTDPQSLIRTAEMLRALSGLYDQAARGAASL